MAYLRIVFRGEAQTIGKIPLCKSNLTINLTNSINLLFRERYVKIESSAKNLFNRRFFELSYKGNIFAGEVMEAKSAEFIISVMKKSKNSEKCPTKANEIFFFRNEVLHTIYSLKEIKTKIFFQM